MPIDHKQENININRGNRNTFVVIDGLSTQVVQTMNKSIHFHESKQKFFDVPLYCKAVRNMTPKKAENFDGKEEGKECDNNGDKEDEKKKPEAEAPRPKIPGLPEKDRKKQEKQIKKKQNKKNKEISNDANCTMEDFLKTPLTSINKATEDFVFSDYDDSDCESDDSSEDFEDSREALTDAEAPPTEKLDFLSDPKNPPGTAKRAASSPVETKDLKKPKTKESSKNK